jgi:hypothetical protein
MKILTVYPGVQATSEAERTSVVLGKMMSECDYERFFVLQKFLTQIQTRNLNIQNIFFKINWNVVLTVSSEKKIVNNLDCKFLLQTTSTVVTYLVITCQFDAS